MEASINRDHHDLQNWRMKMDTQVKAYRDEISELKKSLNTEVKQLRSEFQELRTTLQQQQEDVSSSLRNLEFQDNSGETKEAEHTKFVDNNIPGLLREDYGKENNE